MPKLWKIRAWFGHMIGKVIGLFFLILLVLGIIWAVRNLDALLKMIESFM